MKLQKTIKKLRLDKELEQKGAASAIGISQSHLSQIENGHRGMSVDVLEKIAKAYKIPVPIIILRSLDETDVPKNRIDVFRNMKPALINIINSVWG